MAPPLPASEQRTLQAVGARRAQPGAPSASEIIRDLRALNTEGKPFVALFDARAIAGERHLLSAWAHVGRARARNEFRLRDRAAEFALFVAGDDQLPRALKKVGVGPDTEEFVLVAERPLDPSALLAQFRLRPDPALYPRPPTRATLERLEVTAEEIATVPLTAWEGLVLERVAFVDLSASRAAPTGAKKD
jgi:tRNA threonylcarbamoyladenosine modification (KEOPS) complex Cgi121 subunit